MITTLQNHNVEQQVDDPTVDLIKPDGLQKKCCKFMRGWGALVTAGAMSLAFLLCISLVPSTSIFPVYKDPFIDMVPLIKQGNVRVYPAFLDSTAIAWENDTYFISLPSRDISSTTKSLKEIIKSYPQTGTNVYSQCWLQNPSYAHPCFFETEWLGNECTETNDFGYREVNGTYSPCVILRIEDTGNWSPVPDTVPDIHFSHDFASGNDPGFVKANCYLKSPRDRRKFKFIQVTPQKGFSRMYFPILNFDPKLYLYPIVTVQVKKLMKGENVTIICQIGAQNAYFLEDSGLVTITFGS